MSAEIVVKKGETLLQASVKRSGRGMVIQAKAHPCIEEFFRERAGKNPPIGITQFGRLWTKMPEFPDLSIYPDNDPNMQKNFLIPSGGYYSIYTPGREMLIDTGGVAATVNLGFLRLVGISEGIGVSFAIKGVFTEGEIRKTGDMINHACKRFYLDHLRPVNIQITMSIQEVSYL